MSNPDTPLPVMTSEGDGRWAYPVDYDAVKSHFGDLVTIVDALGLSNSQTKAVKALLARSTFAWYEAVKANCRTSGEASGLRPIRVLSNDNEETVYLWSCSGPDQFTLYESTARSGVSVTTLNIADIVRLVDQAPDFEGSDEAERLRLILVETFHQAGPVFPLPLGTGNAPQGDTEECCIELEGTSLATLASPIRPAPVTTIIEHHYHGPADGPRPDGD